MDNKDTQSNFIQDIIKEDIKNKKHNGKVVTRFPPEPNGYLHIGHAKAICINFGIADEFGGICHLRMDDTNPTKEETHYVEAIKEDIKWLGFDWGKHLYYGSDYFDKMYEYAVQLIKKGKAYVDDLSADEIREYRGTLTEPGKNSPYRNRSVEENLVLFEKMKNGEFEDGSRVLRAKIDMSSPNLNMRDPVMYRILKASHHRTGDEWNIYPLYDWAHGLEDSIEGITHSLCDTEFENHRPLYDWFLDQLDVHHPRQYEFARLNVSYMVTSKRRLAELVAEGHVSGWDDPRLPTLRGLRRRGYTSASIRNFCERIGVAKTVSMVDIALLEFILREELNKITPRVMAVLRPLKLVIINYPEEKTEWLDAQNNPEEPEAGTRKILFSRILYIEQEDFKEDPPKKYFRLSPGREIRLKHAYYIKCVDYKKDTDSGKITEVHCTYDPETRGGWSKDGRKVKGTSHWVSAVNAVTAKVNLYDRLFTKENPLEDEDKRVDFKNYLNPNSLEELDNCMVEPSIMEFKPGQIFQFLRQGYFYMDPYSENLTFNRAVTLKDTWAKIEKKTRTNR
jgi:glutaminyl-tRNA synthetase